MKKSLFFLTFLLSFISYSHSSFAVEKIVKISASNFEEELSLAIIDARTDTIIDMPEGEFFLKNEVLIDKEGITLRGKGMGKTILNFKEQRAGHPGVTSLSHRTTFQDFTVIDTAGNAITTRSAHHIIFERVETTWTPIASQDNGAYGIYPVLGEHILIKDCKTSRSADAGIYVGQSKYVKVSGNDVYENVAGIEIENTSFADVFNNDVYDNAAGVLVFNLPHISNRNGHSVRVFNNKIFRNNGPNFSMKGTPVSISPSGVGVLLLAAKKVEIFDNIIEDYGLMGIALTNFAITGKEIKNPSTGEKYEPRSRDIVAYNNKFIRGKPIKFMLKQKMNVLIKRFVGNDPVEIVIDGIGEEVTDKSLCLGTNESSVDELSFANLELDNPRPLWKQFLWPGEQVIRDMTPYLNCKIEKLSDVVVNMPEAQVDEQEEEENENYCFELKEGEVNLKALLSNDCEDLASYGLFKNPLDPTVNPQGRGKLYFVSNQLFSDHASKYRYLFIPQGKKVVLNVKEDTNDVHSTEPGALEFPVGTVVAKTFLYDKPLVKERTLLETRLMIKRDSGWVFLEYSWQEKEGKAVLKKTGFVKKFNLNGRLKKNKNKVVDYHAPSVSQCSSCHVQGGINIPLGLHGRFLNFQVEKSNQLVDWFNDGILAINDLAAQDIEEKIQSIRSLPSWRDKSVDLDIRVKSFLDMNCSFCHNPQGQGANTGLFLQATRDSESVEMGFMKSPIAAGAGTGGRSYDVVPGFPDKSIFTYRLESTILGRKMPLLGRSLSDGESVAVIREWIKRLKNIKRDQNGQIELGPSKLPLKKHGF